MTTITKNGFSSITSGELVTLQRHLLDLLLEFDDICRTHNITYYLYGGSVIGALRHNGFIPWDDDVDLLMKKEDFERLLSVIDKDLGARPNRVFSYMSRKTHNHRPFARYVNTVIPHIARTAILESVYNPGIFIDIFILDSVPKKHLSALEKSEEWFHKWLNGVVGKMSFTEYTFINFIEKHVGTRRIFEYFDKKLSRYNHLKPDYYTPRNGFNYAVYDSDVFQSPVYVEFEGHKLPVPTKPEKYLRGHYSINWPIMPEPEQRYSTHYSLTSNLFSADEFVKQTSWPRDRDQIHAVQERPHKYQILRKKWIIKKQKILVKFHALRDELELEEYFSENRFAIEKAEKLQNYARVLEVAAPYLRKQKELLRKFPLAKYALNPGQSIHRSVMNALIMVGRFYDAAALAELFNAPALNKDTQTTLDLLMKLECAMQDNELDLAREAIKSLSGHMNHCPTFVTYAIELGLLAFPTSSDAHAHYQETLRRVGNNFEIFKLVADLHFNEGDWTKAEQIYQQIITENNNGLTMRRAEAKLSMMPDMQPSR